MYRETFFILLHLGGSELCEWSKNASDISDQCRTTDIGREYRGKVNVSKTGIACQIWTLDYPNAPNTQVEQCLATNKDYLQENYCRNPDEEQGGPWCYTISDVRWEYCNVPFCNSTTVETSSTSSTNVAKTSLVSTSDYLTLSADQSQLVTIYTTKTKMSTTSRCVCPCSKIKNRGSHLENLTFSEIKEALKDDLFKLEKEMSVDKKKTSAAIRRRTSARDERKSSATIGILGIIMTCLPILFCVRIDCESISCKRNTKKKVAKSRI